MWNSRGQHSPWQWSLFLTTKKKCSWASYTNTPNPHKSPGFHRCWSCDCVTHGAVSYLTLTLLHINYLLLQSKSDWLQQSWYKEECELFLSALLAVDTQRVALTSLLFLHLCDLHTISHQGGRKLVSVALIWQSKRLCALNVWVSARQQKCKVAKFHFLLLLGHLVMSALRRSLSIFSSGVGARSTNLSRPRFSQTWVQVVCFSKQMCFTWKPEARVQLQ